MANSLIIADTHFGNHKKFANYVDGGFNSRFLAQLEAFRRLLLEAEKAHVNAVYLLGDVFHFRGKAEPEVVNKVVEVMSEFTFFWYVLSGNHDITTEGEYFNSAMLLNGRIKPHITVCAKREVFDHGTFRVVMQPYTRQNLASGNQAADQRGVVLMLHQSVIGALYNGTRMTDGVELSYLKRFKAVFCGHIHTAADPAKSVHIVGAPWQLTFGDDDRKRALIVDGEFNVIKELTSNHPRFYTVDKPEKVKSGRDFYRVVSAEPVRGLPSNAVSQVKVEQRTQSRVASSDPKTVLTAYCENTTGMGFLSLGMEILKEAKKEVGGGEG